MSKVEVASFTYGSPEERTLLRQFVDFHWEHYRNEPRYVPLLDYEYLGARFLGMTGFFEKRNLFHKHGTVRYFLARQDGRVVGRCVAFHSSRYNEKWGEKLGFFGHFECVNDSAVSSALFEAAEEWLRAEGMTRVRGPQNFPMNEATPGFLVEGFDSRPVVYYHFNPAYYAQLAAAAGYQPVMHVRSWEIPVQSNQIEETLGGLSKRIIERYDVTIEPWGKRPLKERKREMLEIYNDAWRDNFGFLPFTAEEFDRIVDDMQLVMDKELFLFVYVKGEPAAFFGGVPNIFELMDTRGSKKGFEILRAAKLLLLKSRISGFRLGYLGVKRKFQRLGLDGVMLSHQSNTAKRLGYEYCDMGWVLETNTMTVRLIERCGAEPSKRYAVYEKAL